MARDLANTTPLHCAAREGHLETVLFLVDSLHCPVSLRGDQNKTPLQLALDNNHSEVVEYLLAKNFFPLSLVIIIIIDDFMKWTLAGGEAVD